MTNADLIAQIEKMTVLELSELVKALEEKFGVSAAAPMAFAAGPAAAAVQEEVVEKTEFEVVITSAGDKKIQVLKVLRELTGLGLKEAKTIVDEAPKSVKEKATKEEAEDMKKKLEAEGAVVQIK